MQTVHCKRAYKTMYDVHTYKDIHVYINKTIIRLSLKVALKPFFYTLGKFQKVPFEYF